MHIFFFFYPLLLKQTYIKIYYFIYTSPIELIYIYCLCLSAFIFVYIFFQSFWQISDFLKTSLYAFEYYKIKKNFNLLIMLIFLNNFFLFFFFLPNTWFLLEVFNSFLIKTQVINLYSEFQLQKYYYFFFSLAFYANLGSITFFIYFLLITTLPTYNLIKYKKGFYFIHISIATLFSSPDLFNQLVLFFLFLSIFEILIFYNILINKIKYLTLNKTQKKMLLI